MKFELFKCKFACADLPSVGWQVLRWRINILHFLILELEFIQQGFPAIQGFSQALFHTLQHLLRVLQQLFRFFRRVLTALQVLLNLLQR